MCVDMVRLDHVRLDVSDVSKSQRFYEEAVGLYPVVRYEIAGGIIQQLGANGRPPGVELWMEKGVNVTPHPTQHIAFFTQDVRMVIERIRRLGYKICREPFSIGDETVAFVRDPDGHLIEFNDFKGRAQQYGAGRLTADDLQRSAAGQTVVNASKAASDRRLTVKVLTNWSAVRSNRDHWMSLFSVTNATPFQSFTWADTWWSVLGSSGDPKTPCVAIIYSSGGKPIGLCPLMARSRDGMVWLEALSAPFADYNDGLYLRGMGRHVFMSLAREWRALGLRKVTVDEVPGHSETAAAFGSRAEPSEWIWNRTGWCSAIELRADEAISFPRKEYARKYRRIVSRERVQIVHHSGPEVVKHLRPFVAMHKRQWEGRSGLIAGFDDEGIVAFYQGLCSSNTGEIQPILTELRWGTIPIAYYFGFLYSDSYLGYRTAFEPELARESPGHLLLALLCEDLRTRGLATFDLMRGEYAYKHLYANYRVPQGRLELIR